MTEPRSHTKLLLVALAAITALVLAVLSLAPLAPCPRCATKVSIGLGAGPGCGVCDNTRSVTIFKAWTAPKNP